MVLRHAMRFSANDTQRYVYATKMHYCIMCTGKWSILSSTQFEQRKARIKQTHVTRLAEVKLRYEMKAVANRWDKHK